MRRPFSIFIAFCLIFTQTTLASQAAVALIDNKGDIGGTLNDLGSSQNVRALVTAMVTAGALQGFPLSPLKKVIRRS